MRYVYVPNARSRTMPKSLSRIVIGFAVPQRWAVTRRVEKKYTSDLNGDWNSLSQFMRFVRSGNVSVLSVYRPGPKTSAIRPSFTKAAICDSRTVSDAPLWISRSSIRYRSASVPSPGSVHSMTSMNCLWRNLPNPTAELPNRMYL